MTSGLLCTVLTQRIPPETFHLDGVTVMLHDDTPENRAIVADVIANYETLAAGIVAVQMKQQAIDGIQSVLDTQAKELGFDSIHTAAVWVTSKNPARKARAEALLAWADSVWDFAEAEWANQEKGMPTFTNVESFLAALPAFGGLI